MRKSDYKVLPRKECKKPSGKTSILFIQINKFMVCHSDDVACPLESDLLDKLQENRQILRVLPSEFDLIVPTFLLNNFPKQLAQIRIVLERNSKKRISI